MDWPKPLGMGKAVPRKAVPIVFRPEVHVMEMGGVEKPRSGPGMFVPNVGEVMKDEVVVRVVPEGPAWDELQERHAEVSADAYALFALLVKARREFGDDPPEWLDEAVAEYEQKYLVLDEK